MKPVFQLAQVVATAAAVDFCDTNAVDIAVLLVKHCMGDAGDDVSADDVLANLTSVLSGEGRLFSSFLVGTQRIWIITESDRSVTTVLLPEDY